MNKLVRPLVACGLYLFLVAQTANAAIPCNKYCHYIVKDSGQQMDSDISQYYASSFPQLFNELLWNGGFKNLGNRTDLATLWEHIEKHCIASAYAGFGMQSFDYKFTPSCLGEAAAE